MDKFTQVYAKLIAEHAEDKRQRRKGGAGLIREQSEQGMAAPMTLELTFTTGQDGVSCACGNCGSAVGHGASVQEAMHDFADKFDPKSFEPDETVGEQEDLDEQLDEQSEDAGCGPEAECGPEAGCGDEDADEPGMKPNCGRSRRPCGRKRR